MSIINNYDEHIERLEAENAKLIAERDELLHENKMLSLNLSVSLVEDINIQNKFGDNLVWFLREFENAEKEYLEEGYLEIYGEDTNGREGSTEITVNEICREAANAIEKLLAEREQWMKQEPHPIADILINSGYLTHGQAMDLEDEIGLVYRHPLPAQQVPEGWQLVPIKCTDEMQDAICDVFNQGEDVSWAEFWDSALSAAPKPEDK